MRGFSGSFFVPWQNSTKHSKDNLETGISNSFIASKLELAIVEIKYLKEAAVRLYKTPMKIKEETTSESAAPSVNFKQA